MQHQRETTFLIDRIRETKLAVSIPLLITIIGSTYYTGSLVREHVIAWHDENYPRRHEVILLAQATRLEDEVNKTGAKVDKMAVTLQSMQISAAISAAAALQSELDRHERQRDDSASWHRQRDSLKRRLASAIAYRDCLLDDGRNCDSLRGW